MYLLSICSITSVTLINTHTSHACSANSTVCIARLCNLDAQFEQCVPCFNIICVISSNTRHSVPLSSSASFFNNSLSICFSLLLSVPFSLGLLLLLIGGSAGFTFPILCADGALLTEFEEPGLDPSLLIVEGLLLWEPPDFSVLSLDDVTLLFGVVLVEGFTWVDFRDWSLFSVFNVAAFAPSVFFAVDRSLSFALPIVLINYNRCMCTMVPRASNHAKSFVCVWFLSFTP